MTSKTDKLRAVFLTALMIGSVFAAGVAFTGSVAADAGSVNATTADHDADSTTDVTVNYGQGNDSVAYVISADTTYDEDTDIYAENLSAEGTSTTFSDVDVSSLIGGGASYNVYAVANNSSAEPEVSEPADGDDLTTWTQATGSLTVNNDRTNFNSGGIVFQGQTATYDAGSEDGNFANNYTLYEQTSATTGSPVRELDTNNGLVSADTAGLSTGTTYFISNDGSAPGDADASFTVREQNFDVAIDGDEVPNDDTGIDVTWTSTNRQNNPYNVTVTADGLDDSELVDIFEDNYDVTDFDTSAEEGVEVQVPAGGDETAAANFSGIDAGSYTFDFDVTDTTASDSASLNVTSAAEADSSFESVERVTRGDISTVNVSLTSSSYATVQIGSESVGYEANVTVQDEDADGYVAFDVNTYTMGNNTDVNAEENAFTIVGDEDSIVDVNITTEDLAEPLASGNYRTTVRTGQSAGATADDVSRLSLTDDAGVTAQNIWTAPGALDADEVIDAVSQDSSIAEGDYVVHEVEANGIFGVIASDTNTDNSTAQSVAAAVTSGNLSLSVMQTDATTQLNRQPKELNYSGLLATDGASIVTDAENNTFYIVANTGDISTVDDSRSIQWDDDAFNATVGLTENTQLVDENSTASAEFSADALEAELSMNEYNVTNAENQTITATTTAADGTEYNVLVESLETEGDGFIEPENPAVAENGELTAEVDFTEASVGDTFSVTLEGPGSEDDSATGTVVEQVDDTTTTAADDTTTAADDTTTAEPTETSTAEPTETSTEEPADTTTSGDDGGSDGGSIPGFGVGIALVAILGAALLALRE